MAVLTNWQNFETMRAAESSAEHSPGRGKNDNRILGATDRSAGSNTRHPALGACQRQRTRPAGEPGCSAWRDRGNQAVPRQLRHAQLLQHQGFVGS